MILKIFPKVRSFLKKIKLIGFMNTIQITEETDIPKEDFENNYLSKGRPVVIRGGYKNSKVLRWDFEYLSEHCGENIVHVRKNVNEGKD